MGLFERLNFFSFVWRGKTFDTLKSDPRDEKNNPRHNLRPSQS